MDTTTFLLTEQFDAVWAVLGNPVTGEHTLVELKGADEYPLTPAENLKARLGSFGYCGLFGYRERDRYANAHSEPSPACALMMITAFPTFSARLTEYLEGPKKESDFESWMKRLHDLTDTRD